MPNALNAFQCNFRFFAACPLSALKETLATLMSCLMWRSLAHFILKYRLPLLILLAVLTAGMIYEAKKVQLSYEFGKAIPIDNPKYIAYLEFKKKFGEDGNLLVIGIQTPGFFEENFFNNYVQPAKGS